MQLSADFNSKQWWGPGLFFPLPAKTDENGNKNLGHHQQHQQPDQTISEIDNNGELKYNHTVIIIIIIIISVLPTG